MQGCYGDVSGFEDYVGGGHKWWLPELHDSLSVCENGWFMPDVLDFVGARIHAEELDMPSLMSGRAITQKFSLQFRCPNYSLF